MKIGYLMQAGVPDVRRHPLSGPANHVKHVFLELRNLGHQLTLLALFDGRVWQSTDLERFAPVTVLTDRRPLRLFERSVRRIQHELKLPYVALFESLRFALACRQEFAGHDLLYERLGWFAYGGGLAARWLHVPWILEVNGDHVAELAMRGMPLRGAQRWMSITLMQKAVRSASHVVATGHGLQKTFVARWKVDPERVTVVENGSELVGLLDRGQLRSFHPDSERNGTTTVAFVGGFDPWHGTNILIRAVARGIAQGASLKLLLVGSGPGLEEARRLVRELHLDECVTFTGQLPPHRYCSLLAQADIGVSSYCGGTEYLAMKVLDYKAAGLAIVASGEHDQPGLIEHARTGWVVPPGDEHALYEAIIRLAADRELRRCMGKAARIEAEQLHGWQRTATRLDGLFSRVVHDHHTHAIRPKGRHVRTVA